MTAPSSPEVWTIRRLQAWSLPWLQQRGVDNARLDSDLLLADALGVRRIHLFLDPNRPVSRQELAAFKQRIQRRAQREPVAYILGYAGFWKHEFIVTPDVLIPRPETELLIQSVLEAFPTPHRDRLDKRAPPASPHTTAAAEEEEEEDDTRTEGDDTHAAANDTHAAANDTHTAEDNPRTTAETARTEEGRTDHTKTPDNTPSQESMEILEIGIGSGALLGALLLAYPHARGTGIDISPEALSVAERNLKQHNILTRATLLLGDLVTPLEGGPSTYPTCHPLAHASFQVIVSNPPYIATPELAGLEPEVRVWEPRQALDGGMEGLDILRRLPGSVAHLLTPGGLLALEIGATQGEAVSRFMTEAGYQHVTLHHDFARHPRLVTGRRPASD